jgi:hypothetical protein
VQGCDGVDPVEAVMTCLYDTEQVFQRLCPRQLVIDLHMCPVAVESAGVIHQWAALDGNLLRIWHPQGWARPEGGSRIGWICVPVPNGSRRWCYLPP